MRDLAQKWTPMPDWHEAVIEVPGLTVRTRIGLNQYLVSGDLDAWSSVSGLPAHGAGAFGKAEGERYSVQAARDRLLVVSTPQLDMENGWHEQGFGVTAISAGLHVFEAEGPAVADLIARATPLDPRAASASAAMSFGGVSAVVYHHEAALRIHVDRSLATYLWTWMETAAAAIEATGKDR
ncbi:hypothetical protein [Mesorhizobium sp. 1M-11]|uniref:hypothetical protein n=1 Tax=Mesorhizobium sp. 1M-11 TaxID=1529006 RepID=UPI0006C73B79|nr:hypothetical protein [Mesorhizobium sp. 1M-11]